MSASDTWAAAIVRLISIELKVPEEEVLRARSLRHDLHMDSVAAANLLFALEEECGVELQLERLEGFDTVESIAQLVARSVGGRAP